jgi:hypothetical protein
MAPASRRKKPAKKSPAKPRKAVKAKRPQAKPAKRATSRKESADELVYTDIRRSMHGAILRHLR